MSKVAIQGNASGTGTFTIAAPNSNTDRTLTLPDEAGTVLTSTSSIPVANLDSAVGITGADMWRISTDFSPSNSSFQIVPNNWERVDTHGFSKIGTGMTESSGVFTFPSTGIWKITAHAGFYATSGNAYISVSIATTVDNGSNWNITAAKYNNLASGESYQSPVPTEFIFDVEDTSTHKVSMYVRAAAGNGGAGAIFTGDSQDSRTSMVFIRLGDT